MENIKDLFQNYKILILNKRNRLQFESGEVFKDGDFELSEIEKVYQDLYFKDTIPASTNALLVEEKRYDISLCHVWQIQGCFFLSEEEYCELFDEFISYQIIHNDYDLTPEDLLNYAKRYEKLIIKTKNIEKTEKNESIAIAETKKIEEEQFKLYSNALKKAYKKYYIGQAIVIKIY